MTRLINLMVRCVMSCVMMMSIHRSDETRVIDMAKQASGSQRPANGQQESDQQQQEGTAFHRLNRLPHRRLRTSGRGWHPASFCLSAPTA
jgi:hypothetical protein